MLWKKLVAAISLISLVWLGFVLWVSVFNCRWHNRVTKMLRPGILYYISNFKACWRRCRERRKMWRSRNQNWQKHGRRAPCPNSCSVVFSHPAAGRNVQVAFTCSGTRVPTACGYEIFECCLNFWCGKLNVFFKMGNSVCSGVSFALVKMFLNFLQWLYSLWPSCCWSVRCCLFDAF